MVPPPSASSPSSGCARCRDIRRERRFKCRDFVPTQTRRAEALYLLIRNPKCRAKISVSLKVRCWSAIDV